MSNVYRQAADEVKARIGVYETKISQLRAALPTLESLAAGEDAPTSDVEVPSRPKRGPYRKKGQPRPPVTKAVVVKNGRKRAAVDPRPAHLPSPRHTCPQCGTGDLKKATGKFGQSGGLRGHVAPQCALPCIGGATATLGRLVKKAGLHSKASCPGCRPKKAAAATAIAPAPARKFVPGRSTSMAGKKKVIVTPACPACFRTDVERNGGRLRFHRAPICGLPCTGGDLTRTTDEDLADGKHTGAACYGCSKATGA